MPVPSKPFTTIADSAIEPDSPLDSTLMTALRDNDIHVDERVGKPSDFGASQANHRHTGQDGSAPVDVLGAGSSGLIHSTWVERQIGGNVGIHHEPMEVEMYWFSFDEDTNTMAGTLALISAVASNEIRYWHGGSPSGGFVTRIQPNGLTISDSIGGSQGTLNSLIGFRTIDGLMAIGKYVGDGNSGLNISISGTSISSDFRPDFVKVFKMETPQQEPIWRSLGNVAGESKDWEAGFTLTNGILGFNADGFELGDGIQVNTSGDEYVYIAWKEGNSSGLTIERVNYAGDGVDDRKINLTSIANAPTLILSGKVDSVAGSFGMHVRFRVMYGRDNVELSLRMDANTGDIVSDGIIGMGPGSVILGIDHPNLIGDNYDLWAFGQALPNQPLGSNPSIGV